MYGFHKQSITHSSYITYIYHTIWPTTWNCQLKQIAATRTISVFPAGGFFLNCAWWFSYQWGWEKYVDNNKQLATYITDTHIQCIHAHIQLYFSTSMLAVYIYSSPWLLLHAYSYLVTIYACTIIHTQCSAHLATSCRLQLLRVQQIYLRVLFWMYGSRKYHYHGRY